ncbi:hypothetical protein HPGCJGGD_0244 [Methylobacterium haplocladii]|nr:hypothetical protein HPGCJGGD_0244 [Methylobacterium haplocladii]
MAGADKNLNGMVTKPAEPLGQAAYVMALQRLNGAAQPNLGCGQIDPKS